MPIVTVGYGRRAASQTGIRHYFPVKNCAAEDKDCLCSIPRRKEAASAASVVVGDGVFQLLAADPEVSGLTVQTEIAGSGKAEELSVEGNLV
jgi:hypothetical protein